MREAENTFGLKYTICMVLCAQFGDHKLTDILGGKLGQFGGKGGGGVELFGGCLE